MTEPESELLAHVDDVRAILTGTRVWAVVGCSPDPGRDSHRVASMLQRRGYTVIPVNPLADRDPRRALLPDARRRSPGLSRSSTSSAGPTARACTSTRRSQMGAQAVWMQLGVIDEDAAARARAAGLRVVMDRCPAIELPRLGL